MSTLATDLRHALRGLARHPGYALAAFLTLAIGIGATTSIFSVVNGVLLRPLPYPDADRLVRIYDVAEGRLGTVSPPNFLDWREEAESFAGMSAYQVTSRTLTGEGDAERLQAAAVTPDFFSVFGVRPREGRSFRPEERTPGADRVVVLSHGLWTARFGGDPSVVGRGIRLDGQEHRVVGVAPRGFAHPPDALLWVPHSWSQEDLAGQRGAHYLDVVARLAPGATVASASAEMRAIAARLEEAYPENNTGLSATVTDFREAMVGDVRPALLVLLGAVGCVLLLACANVAGLGLARAVDRDRELAVRAALGAGRGRLLRLALAESAVLGVAGAAAGLLLAWWGTQALLSLRPEDLPLMERVAVDPVVAGFAAGSGLLAGLLAGLVPALRFASGRRDLERRLRQGGRGLGGGAGAGMRRVLVAGEIGLAVLLLAGCGLLLRSFANLRAVDPGFRTEGVLTFEVSLPSAYSEDPDRARIFFRTLLDRLDGMPGVERAGAVFGLPYTGLRYGISVEELDGRPAYDAPGEEPVVQVRVVAPGYFETLGIPVLRGRPITEADREDAPPRVVVSQSAARLLWPGEDPIGHTVELGTGFGLGGPRFGGEVVGVVGDVRHHGPDQDAPPQVYGAHAQFPLDFMTVTLASSGEPRSLADGARAAVRGLDPSVAVDRIATLEELAGDNVARTRFYALLLGIFSVVALLLAGIGIYGLLAYTVRRRTGELGLRVALGAARGDILRLVLRQAAVLGLAGVAGGLLASIALTGTLRGLLFRLSPTDPVTLGLVCLALLAVTGAAVWIPARRATRVDPAVALRAE